MTEFIIDPPFKLTWDGRILRLQGDYINAPVQRAVFDHSSAPNYKIELDSDGAKSVFEVSETRLNSLEQWFVTNVHGGDVKQAPRKKRPVKKGSKKSGLTLKGGQLYVDGALVGETEQFTVDLSKPKDCPKCWGTGFESGFGKPCSRGCK